MNKRKSIAFVLFFFLFGCSTTERLKTEFVTNACIKPFIDYSYLTCKKIVFKINNEEFYIPANFKTDLASIPKFAWPVMSPAHSSLIKPAIVHDWFYRKTCDFTRYETDLIFYHMLINEGVPYLKASFMYFSVRTFGWNFYNEDYCNGEFKGMDQEMRGFKIASLLKSRRSSQNWMGSKS